jgi:glycosyltransferase involved in cell wall biosynthesis
MRVLLVADWNANPGGTEAYVEWLRGGLRAAGDDVCLLTSSAGSAADGTADYVAFGTGRRAAQAILQIVNPFAVARVRDALDDFRPDVALVTLFAHHLSPAVLHALRGVPTVLSVTDYKCICPIGTKLLPDGSICRVRAGAVCHRLGCVSVPHWIRDRPRYALIRSGLPTVARVLACSRWVQRQLATEGIASEWLTLPVPAPAAGFRRSPSSRPSFLFVGRLEVEKGAATLLHAFPRVHEAVPSARLRMVGEGSQRRSLERLAASLGLDDAVDWTGRQDHGGVERELASAWALVAPSLWAEPLGLAALDAIVRGVPVLVSERGGLGETVESGVSGLLFPNGDDRALAARMIDVATGRAFVDHAVPEDVVRHVADRHGIERHVGRLRGIFREVVEARQGATLQS